MNARYYDSHAGRFMAVDPVGFDDTNLHSFNRYAYASNNPYRYVDPDGRAVEAINWDRNNNVEIRLGIAYSGSVTYNEVKNMNTAIVKAWSGKYGAYTVRVNIVPSSKDLGNFMIVGAGTKERQV